MKTDLQIFTEKGAGHQHQLSQMALEACYLSSRLSVPFCAQNLVCEDKLDCDYLDGYLHAICSAQNSKILCSRFIAITPMFTAIDWYLCSSFTDDLAGSLTISDDVKGRFEFLRQSYKINVNHLFNYTKAFNIEQISLNDDIVLYTILSAYRKGVWRIPLQILLSLTPKYSMVQAFGFAEGLRKVLGDDFNCSFNFKDGKIDVYNIDETYFKEYTRKALTEKYKRHNMYIEKLFENIEMQIDSLKRNITLSLSMN